MSNLVYAPNRYYLVLLAKNLMKFSFKSDGTNFKVLSAFLSELSAVFRMVLILHLPQYWRFSGRNGIAS